MSSSDIPRSVHIQSTQRNIAYALNANGIEFINHHGIDNCPFLNLTFTERIFPHPARDKFHEALGFFPDYFHDWIYVMSISRNLRIHYHALVACKENIREGIDLTAYQRLLALKDDEFPSSSTSSLAERRSRIRQILSANAALLQLRREIYPRLRQVGFGQQVNLSPIYSDAQAIAAYLQKNYLETLRRKDFLFRGLRLVGYKPGGHRKWFPPFSWLGQRRRRAAKRIVARALGVTDYYAMRPTFGPKWGYLLNLMILDLESHHGTNPGAWPVASIRNLAETAMPRVFPNAD